MAADLFFIFVLVGIIGYLIIHHGDSDGGDDNLRMG